MTTPSHRDISTAQPTPKSKSSPLRLMVAENDPKARKVIASVVPADRVELIQVGSIKQARQQMRDQHIDIVLVDADLSDGPGIELVRHINEQQKQTQSLYIDRGMDIGQAIEAVRLGAADLINDVKDIDALRLRVERAIDRQKVANHDRKRYRKLRQQCRKLNEAREEVASQVDILCNDLVTAYQELAMQMQHVLQSTEYSGAVKDELDLEALLRKTLEYIIEKAGATNAALFLPATGEEFTLGGYVNYDCTAESADILLEHLADVIAPRLADCEEPVGVTNDEQLQQWLGGDAAYLSNSHLLGVGCKHDEETLAVLVLFRDAGHPFDRETNDTLAAISPMLAEYLARIIRVHHRHLDDDDMGGEDDLFSSDDDFGLAA